MEIALTAFGMLIMFFILMRIAYLVIMDDSDPKEKQKVVTFKTFFNL